MAREIIDISLAHFKIKYYFCNVKNKCKKKWKRKLLNWLFSLTY